MKGILSMNAEAMPESQRMVNVRASGSPPTALMPAWARALITPVVSRPPTTNEETDKEEERIPVHITEYFMRIHTAGKDGKHTACEGDRCRFDTDKIVDDEAENGQSQNGDGFLENGIVRNDGRNTDFS